MTYWQKRSEALAKSEYLRSEEFSKRVRALYVKALSRIEAESTNILKKMLSEEHLSMAKARDFLNKNDLDVFRMDVDDYIKLASGVLTPDKIERLEMASGVHHLTRLQAISFHLEKELELLCAKYSHEMVDFIKKSYEESFYSGVFSKQTLSGYDYISGIDRVELEKIIKKPWTSDGKTFSDRIWEDKERLLNKLSSELFNSVVKGDDLKTVSKNFAREMDVSFSNAKRLIHTESAYFSNEAFKDAIFGETEGFEVLGTLDKRTCSLCGSKDGLHYDWEDYEVGKTAPPFHPYCRCAIVPYFSDARDETRMARSDDGKSRYIDDMGYSEWFDRYVKKNRSKKNRSKKNRSKKNRSKNNRGAVAKAIKNGVVKDEINLSKQSKHI